MKQRQSNYNLNKYKKIDLDSLLNTYNIDRDYTIIVRDIKVKDNKNEKV